MMNDRERAHVVLLRQLLAIERGDSALLGDAMKNLLMAVDGDWVLLKENEGRFERHASRSCLELADILTEVSQDLVAHAVGTSKPALDHRRSNVCLPVAGAAFAGMVYVRTRGVFVDSDIELCRLFAQTVEAVGHELARETPVALHAHVREFQLRRIRHALDRHGGNVSGAARSLGIQRSLVYRLLRRTDNA